MMINNQNKHFTVKFEYDDGYIDIKHVDLLMFRGVRHRGLRPSYITVTCNHNKSNYVCTPGTRELIHHLTQILTPGLLKYRIQIKPIWFNKLISEGQ